MKYYVVQIIGCIECRRPSTLVGIYTDYNKAEKAWYPYEMKYAGNNDYKAVIYTWEGNLNYEKPKSVCV